VEKVLNPKHRFFSEMHVEHQQKMGEKAPQELLRQR
jgi:hypothetical protein